MYSTSSSSTTLSTASTTSSTTSPTSSTSRNYESSSSTRSSTLIPIQELVSKMFPQNFILQEIFLSNITNHSSLFFLTTTQQPLNSTIQSVSTSKTSTFKPKAKIPFNSKKTKPFSVTNPSTQPQTTINQQEPTIQSETRSIFSNKELSYFEKDKDLTIVNKWLLSIGLAVGIIFLILVIYTTISTCMKSCKRRSYDRFEMLDMGKDYVD